MGDAGRYSAAVMRVPNVFPRIVSGWLALSLAGAGVACGGSPEAAPPAPPAAPALGPLELPVSLRTRDAAPSDCYTVELTPGELRVGGVAQLELHGGRFALAGVLSGVASKLDAVWTRPLRSCVTIGAHASVAYQTLALVLASASRAGISRAAFQVRKGGATPELGWLAPASFGVTVPKAELSLPGVRARDWDEFAKNWQHMNETCSRTSQTGGCGYVDSRVASGGSLQITLRAAGQGASLEFARVGLSEAQLAAEAKQRKATVAERREDVAQGRARRTDVEKDLVDGAPANQASFQFRASETLSAPSPLGAVIEPLCATTPCAAVVAAEPTIPVARVLAVIGAAFPDGTLPPALAFEEPAVGK